MQSAPAVETTGLRKSYGSVHALRGVDLHVDPGSVFGLLGPNGAGKTTAVRILTTLLQPDDGSARVAGFDVVRDAAKVRQHIGLAGQYAAVDENLTGFENLEMVGRLYHLGRGQPGARARELLASFGLSDAADRLVRTYSGGMRRRLDLAAALVHNPEVLFLDEPTTGLDPISRAKVWDEVRRLNEQLGMTIFLTTQYLEEADQLAHRVGIINGGKIVAEGTPEELKRTVGTDLVVVEVDGDDEKAKAVLDAVDAVDTVTMAGKEILAHTADGAAAVSPVAVALSDAGIRVRALTLRTPTLDDVFLELTGNRIQEGDR